ncbi:MAG: GPI anchored serine-threonine rich family protein [Cyclobacteriaceae bacterium]|jgi:hypothetical protein|nr:GPI anchored serine-threonine rich family protein [Cyclobacteriaceae bacterium]
MRRLLILCGLVPFIITPVFCQKVQINKVELAGEKIVVHYDLDDTTPGHEYLLNLYSSVDNYNSPLAKVTGDIGPEVKPGTGRKAEWAIRDEYGGYKGKIALEIRGKVYVPFVKLTNFNVPQSYKRGKSYPLHWKPGANNPINVELYRGDLRINGVTNLPNSGSYTLDIPSKAKTGGDYKLKISDTRNNDEVIWSSPFKVKTKVPLFLKILPVAAIGGAAAFVGGGGGGEGPGTSAGILDPPLPSTTKN